MPGFIPLPLEGLLKKFGLYGTVLKWLIVDSVWRFKGKSLLIVCAGVVGVTFQVQAVGLAVYYAGALGKGEIITLLGYEFEPRHSISLLFSCGLIILFSLLLSAGFIYFSRASSLRLRRGYEEFCSKRILLSFGSSLRIWTPFNQGFSDDKVISTLARMDARQCGRVLWMLMNTIIPAITFLVAVGALMYINALLTLLVFILIAISVGFLYKINIAGVKSTTLLEKYSGGTIKEYLQIIKQQKSTAVPILEDELWFEKSVFSSGNIKRYMDAYEGRLRAIESSQLVSNILIAIAVFLIMITLGSSIISKGQGWGELIIYLVALRFMLTNLGQIYRKGTSINRFYPQIRRYFQFVQNTGTPSIDGEKLPESYTVAVDGNPIEGSLGSWNLSKGSCISLISPVTLNRYTLAFLTDCLLGHSQDAARNALGSMWFTTSQYGCLPGRPLRESLGFPPGYKWQDLLNGMKGTGLEGRLKEKLPQDIEKPISPDTWNQVDSDLKYSLALLRACHSNCQWIMLEETGLRSLTDITRRYFLKRLSDRIIVIVHHKDITAVGKYNENIVSLIDGTEIIALGNLDWFKENHARVEEVINKKYNKVSISADSEDDIDMDEI